MAGFQLSSIATRALVQPLYTKATWATMSPTALSKLTAVGFSNLLMHEMVRNAKDKPAHCQVANAITMFGTGIIYTVLRVKSPIINIPFVGSLFAIGVVNVVNFVRGSRTPKPKPAPPKNLRFPLIPFASIMTGISALPFLSHLAPFTAPIHRLIISRVYLSQLAMNTIAAGIIGLHFSQYQDSYLPNLYLGLLGFACVRSNLKPAALISFCGATVAATNRAFRL